MENDDPSNWVSFCSSNDAIYAAKNGDIIHVVANKKILLDSHLGKGGNIKNLYLNGINDQTSNLAVAEIVTWDRALSEEEMAVASQYLADIAMPPSTTGAGVAYNHYGPGVTVATDSWDGAISETVKGTFAELESYCTAKETCTGFLFALGEDAGFYTDAQPTTPVRAYMLRGSFQTQTTRRADFHVYRKNKDDPENKMNLARTMFENTDWNELLENGAAGEAGWWKRAHVAAKKGSQQVCMDYAKDLQLAVPVETLLEVSDSLDQGGGSDGSNHERHGVDNSSGGTTATAANKGSGDGDALEEEDALDLLLDESQVAHHGNTEAAYHVGESESALASISTPHPVKEQEGQEAEDQHLLDTIASATATATTAAAAAASRDDDATARRFETIEKLLTSQSEQLQQLALQNARLVSENAQAR